MKRTTTVLLVGMVLLVLAAVNLQAEESVDPTGNLQRLLQLESAHLDELKALLADIPVDEHPEYGVVKKGDLPFHADGWNEKNVSELYPGEEILSYKVTEKEISGKSLVAHRTGKGTVFYVWHQLENERAVLVEAELAGQREPQTRMAVYHCGNPIWLNSSDVAFYVDGIRVPWYVAKWYLR